MEENKIETQIETKARSEPDTPRKEMSEVERQKRKKLFIYPLMFALFVGVMWLIFAPSDKAKEQAQVGYNTEVPEPTNKQMVGDKQSAYEQALAESRQEQRRTQVQNLADMFGGEQAEEESYEPDAEPQRGGSTRPRETIYASANAYQEINRTLGSFYEKPTIDPEKEELRQKLEELNTQLEQAKTTPKNAIDDQIALMEKSYELAAKYLPQGQNVATPVTQSPPMEVKPTETVKSGKAVIAPIRQVSEQVVSALSQPISDAEFIAAYSVERNMGFNTVGGAGQIHEKNTIRACVHQTTTLIDGQAVRFRLLEPMQVGTMTVPRNSLITGSAKISGERLNISITSLEHGGTIVPVELMVYDNDGQAGIFIPGSMETNAVKEVAANMGTSLGTTVSITNQSAGEQLTSELGKGVIQGTSKYISKKISVVKVTLKAGYNVMLFQKPN